LFKKYFRSGIFFYWLKTIWADIIETMR
jgi:hypothetical protein